MGGLLKTLWEKELMLVTSIFLFFPQCFCPIQNGFKRFQYIDFVIANALNLDKSKMREKTVGSLNFHFAEPHSSFGRVVDLRTGGRFFDPRLCQYSFRGLMIVIVTGIIPVSLLSVVSTMDMLESSQWLGKNIVQITG